MQALADNMRRLFPYFFSAFGLLLTIGLVLIMNEAPPPKQRTLAKAPASFSVPPPPPKIQPKTTSKPKARAKQAPPPLPMLNSALSGMSFGMEGLEDVFAVQHGSLLSAEEQIVMTTETVDLPPRPVQQYSPEYPSRARKKGVEGYVTLSLLINETGKIQDVFVVESYPEGIFEQSAQEAIEQWMFAPGEYEGNPVPVRVTQTLRYSLS